MAVKTKAIMEFGDFQTPDGLAREVCALLAGAGLRPAAILEPTCGMGSFLVACLDAFPRIKKGVGADINPEYVDRAKGALHERSDFKKVEVVEADFFATEWAKVIADMPEPLLVIGNLPWVTNAHLGSLGSQNLPKKSNFHNRSGLDALTGKANFDISEWMLIRLLEAMDGRRGALAMLCKASVARKILFHGWKNGIALERSAIHRIDAALHFDASVEAALLLTHFRPGASDRQAKVYPHLSERDTPTVIGYEDGNLLADLVAYHKWKHLGGDECLRWRSGIKHDCSKVMELRGEDGRFRNGFGEVVELEDEYLYRMMKSSDVAGGEKVSTERWMIVTQKTVGEDTALIQRQAPKTWAYLQANAHLLRKRGSSIYRNRPRFSVFGVGDYSFSPWKIAISGFYKRLAFSLIGPVNGKPVVLDDTSYFLAFKTREEAEYVLSLVNSSTARQFYGAFIFWDAKRPITADLLRRLDLRKLAVELGSGSQYDRLFGEHIEFRAFRFGGKRKTDPTTSRLW